MSSKDGPPEDPRTVFIPGAGGPPPLPSNSPAPPPPAAAEGFLGGDRTFAPITPRTGNSSIQVGDVLNHIFEVKRFIARGGMGEVFEGANVSSEERVAIKVMLPSLAADPNVQAMFRKEARTLTRLAHPALVQYRVLAQEPQLGVLYIVTEFVDGTNLSNELRTVQASTSEAELRALARRLAEGLRAAHALGAIHRDISPDNILLENGQLERAKIIDFGIAKDLDAGSKTIIGGGFAGKLNYAAPEQLGAHGGDVGAWTDVYSLGLVLLAITRGRDVDMGATFADAVDRRRSVPDVSAVPEGLRSVVAQMLVPDPAHRLRSMDAVIAALSDGPPAGSTTPQLRKPAGPTPAGRAGALFAPLLKLDRRRQLIAGGAVVAALVLLLGVIAVASWIAAPPADAPVEANAATEQRVRPPDRDRVRAEIERVLPTLSCAWLDIGDIRVDGDAIRVVMHGAAADRAGAQNAIARALAAAKIGAETNFDEVFAATQPMCNVLTAFAPQHNIGGSGLSVSQHKFEMEMSSKGIPQANAVIEVDIGPVGQDVVFLGVDPAGLIQAPFGVGRKRFVETATDVRNDPYFDAIGANQYRITAPTDHKGLEGILLLTSTTAFSQADQALLLTAPAARSADWAARVAGAAARGTWKAEMIWYETVDDVPNTQADTKG